MYATWCLVILASIFVGNEGSRILAYFPTPSISHQVVFRPLILELIKRNHEVVLVTPDPIFKNSERPPNLKEIDVRDMSYELWNKNFVSGEVTSGNKEDLQEQVNTAMHLIHEVFKAQVLKGDFKKVLEDKTKTFDLLLLEAYYQPLLGLSHVYKVPVIQVSSLGPMTDNLRTVGAPMHPFVHPPCLQQKINPRTIREKFTEVYHNWNTEKVFEYHEKIGDALVKRLFGPETPPLRELRNNVDMIFVNFHPIWELNRPVPPNVIYMGGIHQKPVQELPQDLKKYLDSSKHGVIYVSFGTNIEPSFLPQEKIEALLQAFSKLPYDILWKWNKDVLPGQTENIKISKWLPQSDLLRHPNVKLFITQGGLQSTDEAITAGVPLIGIPMLGDQWFNVEQYVRLKIGLRVDMETISTDGLVSAIQTVVNDNSYHYNIVRLRTIMRDEPQTAIERAVWWTEYVLRHGGAKHLKSPSANMPWTEFYEVELISYLILVILFVLTVFSWFIYYLCGLLLKTNKTKLKNN